MADTITMLTLVPSGRVVDGEAIHTLEEIIIAIKAGTVTGFVVAVKQDGYSRWSLCRAAKNVDRYNLIGQLHHCINELVAMES